MSESKISPNHREAYELACFKHSNSNLARCYLDLYRQLFSTPACVVELVSAAPSAAPPAPEHLGMGYVMDAPAASAAPDVAALIELAEWYEKQERNDLARAKEHADSKPPDPVWQAKATERAGTMGNYARALRSAVRTLSARAPAGEDVVSKLIQAIGTYSVQICRSDAELAPPKYLTDAWDAVSARIEQLSRTAAERGERIAELEKALQFYANHIHWMPLAGSEGPCKLLIANGDIESVEGWAVAEAALAPAAQEGASE